MDANLQMSTNKTEVLHPELSYQLVGLCFDAHNELGRYAREKQYGDYIERGLRDAGVVYERETAIGDSGNIVDFLVEDKIVLELKATRLLTKNHYFQIQNYLQQLGIELGIPVNFRERFLKPRRILKTGHSQ